MILHNIACPELSSGMEIFYFQHIKGEGKIIVGEKMDALKSYFTFLPFSYIYVNFVGAAASVLGSGLLAIEPKCFLGTTPFLLMTDAGQFSQISHVVPLLCSCFICQSTRSGTIYAVYKNHRYVFSSFQDNRSYFCCLYLVFAQSVRQQSQTLSLVNQTFTHSAVYQISLFLFKFSLLKTPNQKINS